MNVAGQMEIELLHRDDLAVAAARGAALDSESGALARLAHARENFLAQMRAERLAQADGRGGLAFAERRGRDRGDDDVFPVGTIFQAVADREMHLRLVLAVQLQLVRENARFRGDLVNRNGRGSLSDVNIAGHAREHVLQFVRHRSSPWRQKDQLLNLGIRGS